MHTDSIALLREHAYLVARGVRPLALAGSCVSSAEACAEAAARLAMVGLPDVVPFVLDRGNGLADYGYAGTEWALDLYRWAISEADDAVPPNQRHRIIGLLLGYSAQAITAFEEPVTAEAY